MNDMNEKEVFPQSPLRGANIGKFGEKTPFRSFRSCFSAVSRAARYVLALPPSISGAGGHNALFRVACVLVNGFDLDDTEAASVLLEYNSRCQPPWSEGELRHKLSEARKVTHRNPAGYLLREREEIDPPPRILGYITLTDADRQPGRKSDTVQAASNTSPVVEYPADFLAAVPVEDRELVAKAMDLFGGELTIKQAPSAPEAAGEFYYPTEDQRIPWPPWGLTPQQRLEYYDRDLADAFGEEFVIPSLPDGEESIVKYQARLAEAVWREIGSR